MLPRLSTLRQLITAVGTTSLVVAAGTWLAIERIGWVGSRPWHLAVALGLAFGAFSGVMALFLKQLMQTQQEELDRHRHNALHDTLTKLPNKVLFDDRLAVCARQRRGNGDTAALLVMDLAGFKATNDSYGRRCGDMLLEEIARRLTGRLRSGDTVARLGGDEFGILLPLVAGIPGVEQVLANLTRALSAPFTFGSDVIPVEVYFGVALIGEQTHSAETYLHRADRAMQRARTTGAGFVIHDPSSDSTDSDEGALTSELRRAIAGGELRLFYQPKARLSDGAIRSVEALIRWQHPRRGLVFPDTFIGLAERSGLMRQMTYWVLDEAMRQAAEWARAGRPMRVAVNLSQQSLLDESIHREISNVLERHRVPAKALEIEITESALVGDISAANTALVGLAEMGIHLSIDDYGTGHSSLAHVRGLPVKCIKIDRSFVWGMLGNETDAAIVRSTIDLARNLGMSVVAEGVETVEQWDALAGLGCQLSQGYLISKPVPARELTSWLRGNDFRFGRAEHAFI